MKHRSVRPMQVAKYGYILMSIVLCLAGLLILFAPTPQAEADGLFFGIAMLLFGAVKLVGYFSRDLFRLAFQNDLQFGILLIILGGITLFKRENVVTFLCIAYGISTVTDGLFRAKTALEARRFGIHSWWLTMSLSVLTGLMGIVIIAWPQTAIAVAQMLLGASLVLEGGLSLSVAVSMVKIIDYQQPDVIDAAFYEVQEETK